MAFYGTSTRRLLAFFCFGFVAVALGLGALSMNPEMDDQKRMALYIFVGVFLVLALVALIGALRTSPVDVTLLPAPPEMPANSLNNRRPRLVGAICLSIGVLLGKWQIFDPLQKEFQPGEEAFVSGKLIGIAIALTFYGITLLLFGSAPNRWRVNPGNVGWRTALLLIAFTVITFTAYIAVVQTLATRGIHSSGP